MTSDFSAGTSSRLPPLPTQLDVPKIPPTQNIGKQYIRFSPFQIHLFPTNYLQRERKSNWMVQLKPRKKEMYGKLSTWQLFFCRNWIIQWKPTKKEKYGKLSNWQFFFCRNVPTGWFAGRTSVVRPIILDSCQFSMCPPCGRIQLDNIGDEQLVNKTLFWGCFSLVVMAAAGGVSGGRRKLWEISFWVFRRQMGSGENGENRKWWKWREQKKATSWWEKVRKRGKLFREQMRLPRPGKKVLIALFLRHQLGEEVEGAAFDQRILDQRIWEGW